MTSYMALSLFSWVLSVTRVLGPGGRTSLTDNILSGGGGGLPGMCYSLKPSYCCPSVSLTPQRFCLHCGQMALSPLLPLPFPECALPPEGLCLFLLPIVLPWPSELHSFNKKPLSHGSERWTSQVKVSEVLVSCEALFPDCKWLPSLCVLCWSFFCVSVFPLGEGLHLIGWGPAPNDRVLGQFQL